MRSSGFAMLLLSLILSFLSFAASLPDPTRLSGHDEFATILPSKNMDDPDKPVNNMDDPDLPIIDHVSQELLDRMKLMSQYAAAACCPGNNNSSLTEIKCPTGNCPLVEEKHVQSLVEFENMMAADTTGYVSIDNRGKDIVVAFRGTKSKANKHEDLKTTRVATGWCEDCGSHYGFWESWVQVRDVVLGTVQSIMKLHPDYKLVVVGHSLGAAVATLAAGEIRQIDETYRNKTELVSAKSLPMSFSSIQVLINL